MNSSHRVPLIFRGAVHYHCFEETEKRFFGLHWGLRWDRKYHHLKTWKKLSENFFEICEFTSHGYSLYLRKEFANTLFVESAKSSLGVRSGPRWKRNYPQIMTTEKLSERMLSDVWLLHTEFHPPFLEQFGNTVVVDFGKWCLGSQGGQWWERKYPWIKTAKKPSEKLHCDVWMLLTELHVSLMWSVC